MVVVSGLVVYLTDQGIGAALFLLGLVGVESTSFLPMLLPSTGWNLWSTMVGGSMVLPGLNWLLWTLGLLLLTRVRLHRMDIP